MEIRCPHCLQYWYSAEEDAGKIRLCPDCADRLRRERGHRGEAAGPFLFTVAGLVAADVALITLTGLWPRIFGVPLAAFGGVLLLIGLAGLRLTMSRGHIAETDWSLARWPMLFALVGAAALLAFCTFVVRPARAAAAAPAAHGLSANRAGHAQQDQQMDQRDVPPHGLAFGPWRQAAGARSVLVWATSASSSVDGESLALQR